MRSRAAKSLAYIVAMALCLYGVQSAPPRPAAAQYAGTQLVFGPLLLAKMMGYRQWLAGPLGNTPAEPSSFKAMLDATHDPYTIAFSAMPGHHTPGATYVIRASQVIDRSSSPRRGTQGLTFAKGPLSLSGGYVRAYVAALAAQKSYEKALGDAYAFQNSSGSGVAIAILPGRGNDILVGFTQEVSQTGTVRHIGCYKEQHYLVDPVTFVATKTRIGCPG